MPTAGVVQGAKYVPTPVDLQTHRQTMFVDPRETNYFNDSVSLKDPYLFSTPKKKKSMPLGITYLTNITSTSIIITKKNKI